MIVFCLDEQLNVNLLDMQYLSKDNENVKNLLVVIDVCSWYAWDELQKHMTAQEVVKKLIDILDNVKPLKIRIDGGPEFNN